MELEGKTILVTRARGQNQEFRLGLIERGAEVIEIPTIEIVEPDSWQPVDEAISRLDQYGWVVFTSANAVDAFRKRSQGRPLPRVAVVGLQTARRAEALGIHVDLVPDAYRSEGVLDALAPDLHGVGFLLPRADIAGPELPDALGRRGASVDTVTVYKTRVPAEGGEEMRRRLEAGEIDCATFTSGSTFRNLITMLGDPHAAACLKDTTIAVIGPVTRESVEGAGLEVTIQPVEATIPALLEAICRYFDEME